MVIYADVLIFTNIIVNYFLLLVSAKLTKTVFKTYRIIIASAVGGIFSLYILLDINNTVIDILFKLVFSLITVFTAFGYGGIKQFLRNAMSLFSSSFIFAGAMLLFWQIFKTNIIYVNNSTVYFDISVSLMIVLSVAVYLIISLTEFFIGRKRLTAAFCNIEILFGNKCFKSKAFFDTGNSLRDNFSDNEVVLVDLKAFNAQIVPDFDSEDDFYKKRYRILPCKTVGGESILEGFRADKLTVELDGKQYDFENPVVMFSKTKIRKDGGALLNSEILTRLE